MQRDRRWSPIRHHHFEAPAFYRIADHEIRLHGQAKACEERRSERIGVVGPQRTSRPHLDLFAFLADEPPNIWRRQIGVAEAGMIHKIAGVGRTPMALEIAWRRHEIAAHVAQPPRPQGGIRQRGNAQRDGAAIADEAVVKITALTDSEIVLVDAA